MVPGKWPAKIVQTIPGTGTMVGPGDIHIDENGNCWRQLSEAESNYLTNNGGTPVANVKTIRDGRIW